MDLVIPSYPGLSVSVVYADFKIAGLNSLSNSIVVQVDDVFIQCS